jgi:bifunctional non-homologous end joining protein LigD
LRASPRISPRRSSPPITARAIPGARAGHPNGFVEPCHPEDRAALPQGPEWLYEIKHDGYRAQIHRHAGKVTIFTRRGYDWSDRFASIAKAAQRLKGKDFIIDGEMTVPGEKGVADYQLLLAALAQGRSERMVYQAFDLLYLDGLDLRGAPLEERKAALESLLQDQSGPIVYASHLEGDGERVFDHACKMGLEGIVAKRRDGRYASGRSEAWIKVKCHKSGTYPIIAFVEKLGARPRRIASLYIGQWLGGRLVYAGKVRSGYSEPVARAVREKLDPLIRKSSPLDHAIKKPKATWVEPKVDAEVHYSAITSDGLLRAAVFKGLREDLEAAAAPAPVIAFRKKENPERPAAREKSQARHIGVPRENILQLLPDAVVPSKEDLESYWRKIAPRALAYLGRRPLKLVRHSHATTFYHKGPLPPIPACVHQLQVAKREAAKGQGCGSMTSRACSAWSRSVRSNCIRGTRPSRISSIPTNSSSTSIRAKAPLGLS